ncbi:activating transcription factor of chaperone [Sitodiplosis mosellana]|uniref:activating transcription factor of chaperone n=1 Tax=Sitodiplosis mosellana TaxID=263140 RepID=UPI002443D92E|nr:activating transcription factor of chaperone [Sitodiplosis mosellana]
MESLELPHDIIWDGDRSPMTLSPDHFSDASAEQILIFEDSFVTELIPNDDLIKPSQTIEFSEFSPEEFEQLLEIQQDLLDNMVEEDQSNDQWLDQPIIPLDEYAPVQDARIYPVKVNTAQLLNEFNQVYDAVELTHLTPPETPPQTPPQTPLQSTYLNNDSKQNQFFSQPITNYQLQLNEQFQQCKPESKPIITNIMPAIQAQQFPSILEQAINLVQQTSPIEYTESFDDAMAEVEALVRSRAEDFADSSIDDDSSMCGSSSCFSPRSEASSSTTDDSDWTMKCPAIATAFKNKQAKQKQKRKPRINRRSPEDRQSRKKEQNKSAANRYRLKKKAEIEILLDEEKELIKCHDALKSRFEDIDREVKFIKKLLRDLFKAKGSIK